MAELQQVPADRQRHVVGIWLGWELSEVPVSHPEICSLQSVLVWLPAAQHVG